MMTQVNRKIDCEYILKLEPTRFAKKIHVGSKSKVGVKNDYKVFGLSNQKEEVTI